MLGFFFGIIDTVILTRILGPAGIGQFALVRSFLTLAVQIFSLGLPLSFLYFSQHDSENLKEYLMNTIWLTLLLGSLGSLAMVALLFYKVDYFGQIPLFALFGIGLYIPIVQQAAIGRNNLLVNIEAKKLSLMSLMASIIGTILIVILWEFRILSVGQAILSTVFTAALRASLGWYWMRKNVTFSIKPSRTISKKLISMGIKLSFADLMVLVNAQLNLIMVKYFLHDFASVGYFSRAQRIALLAVTAGRSILPLLFSQWAMMDEKRIASNVEKVMRFASIISVGMIAIVLLTGKWIILILYGENFLAAVEPMIILAPGAALYLLSLALMQLMGSRGNPEWSAYILLISMLINVVLCALLIPTLGIRGGALASTVGNIAIFTSLLIMAKMKFNVRIHRCIGFHMKDIEYIEMSLLRKNALKRNL